MEQCQWFSCSRLFQNHQNGNDTSSWNITCGKNEYQLVACMVLLQAGVCSLIKFRWLTTERIAKISEITISCYTSFSSLLHLKAPKKFGYLTSKPGKNNETYLVLAFIGKNAVFLKNDVGGLCF